MRQLFHYTVAWLCGRAGIESQPMSYAGCGVSAFEANHAKMNLLEPNNGTESADAKQNMVMLRH